MAWGRSKHQTRKDVRDLLARNPGSPASGSLWEKIVDFITQVDSADNVSIGDEAALRSLASRFRLSTSSSFETMAQQPADISANQNDYDPGTGVFFRLNPTGADRTITGMVGGVDGRWRIIQNVSSSRLLTFTIGDTGSGTTARFYSPAPDFAAVVLREMEAALYLYDPHAQGVGGWLVWKIVGQHNILSGNHLDTVPAALVLGDLLYANSTPKLTKLAGNTTALRQMLVQAGTGAVSAAPSWDTQLDRLGIGGAADGTAALRLLASAVPQAFGILEGLHGAAIKLEYDEEEITVAAAASTDSAASLIHANSLIGFVLTRVTATIPTATLMDVGTPALATRFATGIGVTTPQTSVNVNQWKGGVATDAAGPTQAGIASKVRITPNATPANTNGKVRVGVFSLLGVPPTS